MKNFNRKNTKFSLCGLNCALCVMYIGEYCPGCGGGEGNQACRIARCSLDKSVEFCYLCNMYPCEKYDGIERYDSFITHRNQMKDMEKARIMGIANYSLMLEQKEKMLRYLSQNYDEGRSKSFYCLAVNLMDIEDMKQVIENFENSQDFDILSVKQKAYMLKEMFKKAAYDKGIILKLNKKD